MRAQIQSLGLESPETFIAEGWESTVGYTFHVPIFSFHTACIGHWQRDTWLSVCLYGRYYWYFTLEDFHLPLE